MTWDELREYCLAKPGAWPDEPWGDGVVAKVGPKIFAFLGTGDEPGAGRKPAPVRQSVGLKCGATREAADEWLLRFPGDASVMRYIGRSGWNNLVVGGAIPDDEIFEAVDASYATVVSKLPKKDRPVALRARGRPPGVTEPGRTATLRLKWTGDPPRRAGVSEPAAGPAVSGSRAR
jgi:predicted DNA-binding protein (MmcQ/YjbR family)